MGESGRINWIVMACSVAGHVALAGMLASAILSRPAAPRVAPGDTLIFQMLPAASAARAERPAMEARFDRAPMPRPVAAAAVPRVAAAAPVTPPGGAPTGHVARVASASGSAAMGAAAAAGAQDLAFDAAAQGAHLRYQRLLHDLIAQQAHYPDAARAQHAAGLTRIGFRLDRLGHVVDSWVQGSSGVAVLDGAAQDALRRADPLPPVPPVLPAPIAFVIEFDAAMQGMPR